MADSDVKPAIVYDITGFDRSQVVEQLEGIVNHVGYRNKNFFYYLGISKVDQTDQFCKFFKLVPQAEKDEPGNGNISVFKGPGFTAKRSYNRDFVKELRKEYGKDTSLLAKNLEGLFENNTKIVECSFLTSEVYILLLFEIARRRVKDREKSTPKGKKYDELKIDEAITDLIELMKADVYTFKDIFLEGEQFHCFSGEPDERKAVIERIKDEREALEINDTEEGESDSSSKDSSSD